MKKLDDTKPVPSDGLTNPQLMEEIRAIKFMLNELVDWLEKLESKMRLKK